MGRRFPLLLVVGVIVMVRPAAAGVEASVTRLTEPMRRGRVSVEEALQARRSLREFSPAPISLVDVAQLLWAAQGITGPEGGRTAPSAGALYPLEIYLVAGKVTDLGAGVYRYLPASHALERLAQGDRRSRLARAARDQDWIALAPAILAVAAVHERTTVRYGARGRGYVLMEAGHAAQNVSLEAVALGLGTTVVGAFDDGAVRAILEAPPSEAPLCLLPVGRKP